MIVGIQNDCGKQRNERSKISFALSLKLWYLRMMPTKGKNRKIFFYAQQVLRSW